MNQAEQSVRRPTGPVGVVGILCLAVIVFVLPATVHVLNLFMSHGFPLGFFTTAHVVPVLCAALGWTVVWRQSVAAKTPSHVMEMPGSLMLSGLSLAIAGLGVPLLFVFMNAAYHRGYDGLVFGVGWTAGMVVLTIWTVPLLVSQNFQSVSMYLARRVKSPSVGRVAIFVTIIVNCGLLAGVFAVLANLAANVLSLHQEMVLASVAVCIIAMVLWLPQSWLRRIYIGYGVVVMIALTAVVSWIGMSEISGLIPHYGYGAALDAIAKWEHGALVSGAADPVTFKVHARPEIHFSRMNFAALTLCLMLGTAVMPHLVTAVNLLSASRRQQAGAHFDSGFWTGAFALIFVVLIVVTVPAIAAAAKNLVFREIIGQQVSDLPAWLFATPGQIRVADICGQTQGGMAAVVAACSAQQEQISTLRVDDVAVSGAQVVLFVLAATKAPIWVWLVCALGGVVAFLSLLALLGTSLKVALVEYGTYAKSKSQHSTSTANVQISVAVLIAGATGLALIFPNGADELLVGSFSVAAGALFPAMLVATWRPNVKPAVVVIGLIAGLIGGLLYLLGSHLAPVVFFHLTMPLSNATDYAIEDYFELLALWRSAGPETTSAAWSVLTEHCRPLANWWGLRPGAAGLIGMTFSSVAMIAMMSFVGARRQSDGHKEL